MVGSSVGNAAADQQPWADFNWSLIGELGYPRSNSLGMGPGVYRIQPFAARAGGPTQGGLYFNLQQQLGEDSPFGWFGRFGFGGSEDSGGASAQVGSGFVTRGPFKRLLFQRTSNDLLGVGFVWCQPSASSSQVAP